MADEAIDINADVKPRQIAMLMNFAQMSKLMTKDLKNDRDYQTLNRKYKQEDVIRFLEDPRRHELPLRNISTYLYLKSSHYRRLCWYFSKMATFEYILEPYNIDAKKVNIRTLELQYWKVVNAIDIMNIKHEFSKIMDVIFRDDVFYGYEHQTNDSYFIQKLHPDLCKISGITDGCYDFAFDFSFFDKYSDKLESYDPEFKAKYRIYQNDRSQKWQELDSKKTICIKVNETIDIPVPPFAGVFESIFDIDEYAILRKEKEEMGNYKILVQRLPMRDKSDMNNDFSIDYDNMIMFHNKASETLHDGIGMITSPMEIDLIDLEKDVSDRDNVSKAVRDFWDGAGVPQVLFNAVNGHGLDKAIRADEAIVFALYRQFERWLNRKIKFISTSNFRVEVLNVTEFNRKEMFDLLLRAGERGLPVKTRIGASIGLSPSSIVNMAFLENEVFKFQDSFIPLASSHTQSDDSGGGEEGGRPLKADDELTEEGIKTRGKEKRVKK